MTEFQYQPMFPLGEDATVYDCLTPDFVKVDPFGGTDTVRVAPEALRLVSEKAFQDSAFLYRTRHLEQLAAILKDPESSDNDRYVALEIIKNAVIASSGQCLIQP